jgi:23S rRNA (cytosine1962-C5)-methyltransferase
VGTSSPATWDRQSDARGRGGRRAGRRPGPPPGRRAPKGATGMTHEVVAQEGDRALLALRWDARSQPVRPALASLGAPIAGDLSAGGPAATRLMLHVEQMAIAQPTTGEALNLRAPAPPELEDWLGQALGKPWQDETELDRRLHTAIDRRYQVAQQGDTDALRLVNGAGDDLPGVTVDRYGDYLVVALSEEAALAQRETILDGAARLGARGCYLKIRPKQANVVVDTRKEDLAPSRASRGVDAPPVMVIHEAGLPYEVRLGDGLSTGIFLDQRRTRALVRELSEGKRVLNLFGYHGAFTIAAIAGGADQTVTVDSSGVALERAERNLTLAGCDRRHHELRRSAAQPWLERRATGPQSERFDLCILDPPSFSTTKRSTFRAARDYPTLAAAALRCLTPGGLLFACTNHRGIVRAKFRRQLADGARRAGREVQQMDDLPDPIDFPPALGSECHLKSVLVRVV